MSEAFKKLEELAEPLRKLIRALKGQSIDEDMFSGMVNVKDRRERTRLSEYDVYGHSGMRLIASWYRDEMGFWGEIADMEDAYFLSLDGEQFKEMIAMVRAKSMVSISGAVPIPSEIKTAESETKPMEEKKKGLFHR